MRFRVFLFLVAIASLVSGCKKDTAQNEAQNAVFTMALCWYGPIWTWTNYHAGVPITSNAVFPINVDVSSVGTYSISTNMVNGILFSISGTFTSTGWQALYLKGLGTPVHTGTYGYTVSLGNTYCVDSVTVLP